MRSLKEAEGATTARKRTRTLPVFYQYVRTLNKKLGLLLTISLVVSALVLALPGVALAETVVATVAVGTQPFDVGVNPTTNKIYVANWTSNNVSVIDGATDTVSTTVAVGNGPVGVGVNPTTNKIYVANNGSDNVSVIDGATDTVSTTVAVGTGPTSVGVNSTTNKVYVANQNSNNVSVIDGATDTVSTAVAVGINPRGVSVNPTTNKIYVSNINGNNVSVIDGATDTVSTTVAVGTNPFGVGVNPTTNKIYVANHTMSNVSVIDGSTDTVSATVAVGTDPEGVGVNPTTNKIYVPNNGNDNVSVIDGATDTVSTTVAVGTLPGGVGVNPATNKTYVANHDSDDVSVLGYLTTWYLAEGTTAWGYNCYISIENPNGEALTADITYMTDAGEVDGGTVNLPANSQTTVCPGETIGERDFSTKVVCNEGKTIAVDRTMLWPPQGSGAGIAGDRHCSIGVTAPGTTWYLPEGSSAWGFECWHLIQNPNAEDAHVTLTYMIEGAAPEVRTKTVPANSRATYNMAEEVGSVDASLKVESDIAVIPERAMYRYNRQEGHDSIGTITPALNYYLAEGTTAWGFTTYVLIQNPQDTATDVNVTYMTPEGAVAHPGNPINMPANSRYTIRVNDYLPESDFSTQVTGSQDIIAERAMYWGEGTEQGEACHDSIGMDSPHMTFFLPDGMAGSDVETWTLVQNPGGTEVDVTITYLLNGGGTPVVVNDIIPANSRKTYSMADAGIGEGASILVESKTAGNPIMVERAMYWANRGMGADTIGGYSD